MEDKDSVDIFTVLLAIDRSKEAEKALNFYLESMHRPSTEILLFHCMDASNCGEYMAFEPDLNIAGYEVWLDDQRKEKIAMEAFLAELSTRLKSAQVKHRYVIHEGGCAGEAIVNMADKEKARYVVMGTRGQGTLRRTIFGSVSDYVLHHAAVPVFVFRDHH